MSFREYQGRTDGALMAAEDLAHRKASEHGGSKSFHVVEAYRPSDNLEGEIWVADAEGLEELQADDRYESVHDLNSFGIDDEDGGTE